ncbi:HAD hydrolase family protein [Pseudomonas gingeri]|uniref:HAD hydrolase family protein n=1 Tax=Pseudomonas gingeri TaxID=117681 RepID=UPI0015A3341F|nr:HAD hydrolase family protein [Pseudomonas gingeri]NWD71772.1 HAD hydrolase family protein [Pseudomonas gingeri]
MGKPYTTELDNLDSTVRWCFEQSVDFLREYLSRWKGEYAYFVGSGGSYSAAYAASELREIAHGSPTRSLTPMELSAKAKFTPSSKVMLLTAEGRNPDILTAASCAMQSDMTCAALTLTSENPLTRYASETGSIRPFVFDMPWGKDGYLATNTLIATVVLLHRAFFSDERSREFLIELFEKHALKQRRDQLRQDSRLEAMRGCNFIVLHDPMTKSFAIDLESKLSEAALAKVEVADFRQFAHGRHLQLASTTERVAVIAAYSADAGPLAHAMLALFPTSVQTFQLEVPGKQPHELVVAGLLMATLVTEAIAAAMKRDPGQPIVPLFGKAIYQLDSSLYYQGPPLLSDRHRLAALRKFDHRIVTAEELTTATVAAEAYAAKMETAVYKAVISDFDGTLCNTEERYHGMCRKTARQLTHLMEEGLILSVASGRGDSLQKSLREAFPREFHKSIWVGYYGGSLIQSLDETFERPTGNEDFKALLKWLETTIYYPRVKEFDQSVRGGQLTIRVSSTEESRKLRLALRTHLNNQELFEWRVFCSGHSIDVLDAYTSKKNVLNVVAEKFGFNPQTEILRLGDSGDEEGNDYELLSEGCSLSAERVSASLVSCWNLAPSGCSQAVATLSYLERLHKKEQGHMLSLELPRTEEFEKYYRS